MARRPKPPHLHLIQGTGRADRHNLKEPPVPPVVDLPAPPAHLTKFARLAWDRLTPLLAQMGVLTPLDFIALERTCECYAEVRRHGEALELLGETYETKNRVTGEPMVRARPEKAMLADADRRLKSYLTDFGLTPAARSKVRPSGGGKPDPLDSYFT